MKFLLTVAYEICCTKQESLLHTAETLWQLRTPFLIQEDLLGASVLPGFHYSSGIQGWGQLTRFCKLQYSPLNYHLRTGKGADVVGLGVFQSFIPCFWGNGWIKEGDWEFEVSGAHWGQLWGFGKVSLKDGDGSTFVPRGLSFLFALCCQSSSILVTGIRLWVDRKECDISLLYLQKI